LSGIALLCIGLGGWSVKVVRQLKPSVGGCSENETTTGRGLLLDTALLPPPGNACWITLPGLSARHPIPQHCCRLLLEECCLPDHCLRRQPTTTLRQKYFYCAMMSLWYFLLYVIHWPVVCQMFQLPPVSKLFSKLNLFCAKIQKPIPTILLLKNISSLSIFMMYVPSCHFFYNKYM